MQRCCARTPRPAGQPLTRHGWFLSAGPAAPERTGLRTSRAPRDEIMRRAWGGWCQLQRPAAEAPWTYTGKRVPASQHGSLARRGCLPFRPQWVLAFVAAASKTHQNRGRSHTRAVAHYAMQTLAPGRRRMCNHWIVR